jgi:hypothetical protein
MKHTSINLYPHRADVTFPDRPAESGPDLVLTGDTAALEHAAEMLAKGLRFASRGAATVRVRKFDLNGKAVTQ